MLSEIGKWANDNQGVVTVLLFVLMLVIAWVSGIFQSLRRKPKFSLELIPGPTLCSTFTLGQKHGEFGIHRTAIALYLSISNVGSAASSIVKVSVAYHWHLGSVSWLWIRYRIGWFWIDHSTTALEDFQYSLGEIVKVYPALLQGSAILGKSTDTFLDVGRRVTGVVYFEQDDSYGGCFPSPWNGRTKVKVAVVDVFGGRHTKTFWIPVVSLEEARKYNPSFGATITAFRTGGLPCSQ